ncbi:MAG TPA: tyrosine-type recombinase/integrase, partial [Acidimicrobiia bacterium]
AESRRAGLTPIGVHGLRHSYATAGLQAGVPTKVISSRLGHASVSITMDRYQHVLPEEDREAAIALAERMVGAGPDGSC